MSLFINGVEVTTLSLNNALVDACYLNSVNVFSALPEVVVYTPVSQGRFATDIYVYMPSITGVGMSFILGSGYDEDNPSYGDAYDTDFISTTGTDLGNPTNTSTNNSYISARVHSDGSARFKVEGQNEFERVLGIGTAVSFKNYSSYTVERVWSTPSALTVSAGDLIVKIKMEGYSIEQDSGQSYTTLQSYNNGQSLYGEDGSYIIGELRITSDGTLTRTVSGSNIYFYIHLRK